MDRRLSVWQSGSMPGQKSIRLAKKSGGPSFPNAGFCALLPRYPFSPASLCGKEEEGKGEGQREDGYDRPTNLEIIRFFYYSQQNSDIIIVKMLNLNNYIPHEEARMFQVSEKATEKIKEYFKDKETLPSIRIILSQGG